MSYPNWICHDCGVKYGRVIEGHIATYHQPDEEDNHDFCGWCDRNDVPLTEPRDFGHPKTREIYELIQSAIEQEREECAGFLDAVSVAHSADGITSIVLQNMAQTIRQRGTK